MAETRMNDSISSTKSGSGPMFRSATLVGAQQPLLLDPIDNDIDDSSYRPSPPVFTSPTGWKEPRLTTVGLYYPLGPCLMRMTFDRLHGVLNTLPDIFRRLSLHASYQETPISATCRSLDQVEFEVSIFASRTNPREELLVEIERRDGDVIAYQNYAQQIACALTGTVSPLTAPSAPCFWNRSEMDSAESLGHAPGEAGIRSALETTWNLITMDRWDARRLGMESLIHMTDPYKCGLSVAKSASESLLFPKDNSESRVARLVFQYARKEAPATEFHSSQDGSFFGGSNDVDLAYLSLIIVTQALQVAAEAKTMDVITFLSTQPVDLVECLLEKLHEAQAHPHRAYYAAQSLVALCHCDPSVRSRIKNRDVEEAQLYGDSCHLALATASHKLLHTLQT